MHLRARLVVPHGAVPGHLAASEGVIALLVVLGFSSAARFTVLGLSPPQTREARLIDGGGVLGPVVRMRDLVRRPVAKVAKGAAGPSEDRELLGRPRHGRSPPQGHACCIGDDHQHKVEQLAVPAVRLLWSHRGRLTTRHGTFGMQNASFWRLETDHVSLSCATVSGARLDTH